MRREIDEEIEIEFEYREVVFVVTVPVTGHIDVVEDCRYANNGDPGEPGYTEDTINVNMTKDDAEEWVAEQFLDTGLPVPPWAHDEAGDILDEIKDKIKAHVDAG